MRVLSIVHEPTAGPGVFADVLDGRGTEVETWTPPEEPEQPALDGVSAILAYGGAMHVDQEERHPWLKVERDFLRSALESGTPLLAVCLGSQLLAQAAAGEVRRVARPEIGWHEVEVTADGEADALLAPLAPRFEAFQWHAYGAELPPRAVALAKSQAGLQAFRIGRAAWGVQFHAEVSRPDVLAWIDDAGNDPDAAGIDEAELRDRTERSIEAWNETGRALCGRFLDAATRA
jgi:GMP synthase (glutamine-hydrolysing)